MYVDGHACIEIGSLFCAHDESTSVFVGLPQIRGEILGLEVEPKDAADNFFADSLSSGETKADAGAIDSRKQRAISAATAAKAFAGELPWD